ncbi:MAG: c-type cytochrome [Geminicoccales bacterium]
MKSVSPKFMALGLSLAVAVGGTTSLVYAHSGAKGVMKERMEIMKGMGDALKTMGAMFKGQADYDPTVIAEKAAYLAEHARNIPELTPENSNDHPSEALPIIWQEWDGYVESAELLAVEGGKLVEIANNGAEERAAKIQFAKVSKTCGTCHEKYRKPKDDKQS